MASAAHTIASVKARQIFDSRGNPTIEVDVTVTGVDGVFRGAVPSGASTGIYEALELRDGDKSVYMGKGVSKAIANVNTIIGPAIIGMDVTKQQALDDFMVKTLDGSQTENGYTKSKLGANAILGVSMAACRAGAAIAKLPLFAYIATLAGRDASSANVLPVPFFNVLNAGEHSGAPLVFQEFMIAPVGATSFTHAMRIGTEVYHHLKACVSAKYGASAVGVGDEGGFAPPLATPQEALDLIQMALSKSGHVDTVRIALDVAASEFAVEGGYDLNKKSRRAPGATMAESEGVLTGEQLLSLYSGLVSHYPIISIEDGFEQSDWAHWGSMTAAMGSTIQIVGDDLLVTNPIRVKKAIDTKACTALLLKLNQIGSVSEAIQAVVMAQEAGWGVMTSHRSGETEDAFIADLCVGLNTRQIKSGAAARGERTAKYNQLLRIEEALGERAVYAGSRFKSATA